MLTEKEIEKIRNLCFKNTAKSCAIVQEFIYGLQIVYCAEYADLKSKKKRTIQYRSKIKILGYQLQSLKYHLITKQSMIHLFLGYKRSYEKHK